MITSPPPAATMAEKAILSAMMQEPSRLVPRAAADGITEDSFSTPANRLFFATIRDDHHAHGAIDLIAYVQRRQNEGVLDRMGGPSGVSEINGYAFSTSAWSQWVSQVKAAHAVRTAQEAGRALADTDSAEDAVRQLTAALEATRRASEVPRRSVTAETACNDFIDGMKSDHAAGALPGGSTGIAELDHITGGLKPGQLFVAAARSTHGKSVLLLQVAAEYVTTGKRVLVCTLEMNARETIGRLVSCIGRVNMEHITQPRNATKGDLAAIDRTIRTLASAHLHIDDSANQTLETIRSEAERIRDTHGRLDLLVVDYIQLVDGDRGRNETREREIARVSGGLKQLAKKIGCPVLTASQLNDDGRVRESRAIEQDADLLIYITGDGLKIAKNRQGRRNDVLPLFLDGPHQRFTHAKP